MQLLIPAKSNVLPLWSTAVEPCLHSNSIAFVFLMHLQNLFFSSMSFACPFELKPSLFNFLSPTKEKSMRIPVLLPPYSMLLACLVPCALLLLLCSACLGSHYENCLKHRTLCGSIEIGYPFGENGSGCGDPDFQIYSCDSNRVPLIDIGGIEYHILHSSFLANDSTSKVLNIVNDNLWGTNCNLSGNYSPFWWPDSLFQINDTYANLTLWKPCDQISEKIYEKLSLCGNDWYYSLNPELNLQDLTSCNVFQLPINKNFTAQFINESLREGFEVTWQVDPNRYRSCGACLDSKGSCGYNNSGPTPTFICYCPNGTSNPDICPGSDTQGTGRNMSEIIIGCSVVGVAALLLLLMFYAKRRALPPGTSTSKVEKFLKAYAYEMPTRYSLSRIKKITNNFAEELGAGGYGVVYKGKLPNGALVAVKLLDRHRHSETQFMNEVATIGLVHHVNLVRLLGYCFESPISALVYEYMVNGSLEKFIFAGKEKGRLLRWEQLYSIALGAAHGIAYLHQDCEKRIIHFDIKPHNILLDAEFKPKVADFGLAKLCGKEEDHISMTAGRGTPGYVAPELCDGDMGPVTDKSDVYSFGMLLLEMVGGRKNIDSKVSRSSQYFFPEWAFTLLQSGELGMRLSEGGEIDAEDEGKAKRLTKVGLWCIQYDQKDRPCMSRVVQMLEGKEDDVPNPSPCFNSPAMSEKPILISMEKSRSI